MKLKLIVFFFATAAGISHAGEMTAPNGSSLSSLVPSGAQLDFALPGVEAKGRAGSRRVGGSGRSGKGGRYVGGRR